MNRWALIPVKGFDRGKSRLSDVLPPQERAALTRNLFEHVVRVLQESPSVDAVASHASIAGDPHTQDNVGKEALAGG